MEALLFAAGPIVMYQALACYGGGCGGYFYGNGWGGC
jgi:hypothetical protein